LQRLARFVRPAKTLILYPWTWVVLLLILVTHLSFAWWLQPTPVMQGLAVGMDAFAVLLWGVLALQSEAWGALYSRMPYEATARQVQKLLAECSAAFAIPARRCFELAQCIFQECTETASRHELDALMSNIAHLAHAHRTLHLRVQHLGTPEQKASMASMLQNTWSPSKTRYKFWIIHVRRDSRASIAYSEELISATMSATLQSTDRHDGIVGQECCHFQRDL
jgi:hypothetical protein